MFQAVYGVRGSDLIQDGLHGSGLRRSPSRIIRRRASPAAPGRWRPAARRRAGEPVTRILRTRGVPCLRRVVSPCSRRRCLAASGPRAAGAEGLSDLLGLHAAVAPGEHFVNEILRVRRRHPWRLPGSGGGPGTNLRREGRLCSRACAERPYEIASDALSTVLAGRDRRSQLLPLRYFGAENFLEHLRSLPNSSADD